MNRLFSDRPLGNSGTVFIDSTSALAVSGNYMQSAGLTTVNGALTPSNGHVTINGGTMILGASNALPGTINLTIGNGTTDGLVQLASGIGPVTVGSSTVNTGSTLDVTNNSLLIDYGSGPDPIASIAQWIANGYYNLPGPQIISSAIATADAASGLSYGIGYADSADPGNPANLPTDTIEIMFTLLGDANLDGTVNAEDFTLFSEHLGQSGMMWDDGDFNHDGTVNAEDFTLFSHNLGQSASLAAQAGVLDGNGITLANVPEPGAMLIVGMALAGALRRRRRVSCR